MDALTNGVTIVADDGTSYHSFTDFGLAIGNNNYIEAPEYDTYYVEVPGRDGLLDLTEMITGRPTYRTREINIELGGMGDPNTWDAKISQLRNLFHGHVVKLIFDNDPTYYWTGRAEIIDYDRFRNLGTFTLAIPQADPFKYSVEEVVMGSYEIAGASYVRIDPVVVAQPVHPTFYVSNFTTSYSGYLEIMLQTRTGGRVAFATMHDNGVYTFPDFIIESGLHLRAAVSSSTSATLQIKYRQESL